MYNIKPDPTLSQRGENGHHVPAISTKLLAVDCSGKRRISLDIDIDIDRYNKTIIYGYYKLDSIDENKRGHKVRGVVMGR